MLSEEVIDLVSERLVERIEDANRYILKKIGGNIKALRSLSYTDAHKLAQIMKYGGDYEKIINKLADITALNEQDIEDMFDEVARSEYEFAEQFYNAKKVGYVPYNENDALMQQVDIITSDTQRSIRSMMQPSVLGYGFMDQATGLYTFKGLQQTYYDMIDEAVLSITQGKETFDEGISRQIKQMGGGGLKVVYDSTYLNNEGIIMNRTRRLDSAVRMNVKDAIRTMHNENQERFGKEFGADGVEVSVHGNPAPDHADMQGHQFSKKEFEKLQAEGYAKDYKGKIIDITHTSKKGHVSHRAVGQYNCYHKAFSIVLGVNKPSYTNKELQEIIDENNEGFELDGKHYTKYEGTQIQRRLETEVRKQKDIQIMAKEAGDQQTVLEAQQKITELTNKYKEVSDIASLPTRMDRMRVSDYRRTDASKVINRADFKTYEVNAPAMDYPKYKQDFNFPSNDALNKYVKQGGNMFDNMQKDATYKKEMYDIAKNIEDLKRPVKDNFVLYSGQNKTFDLSKSDFLISGSIGKTTAEGYTKYISKNKKDMDVVKIYVEKGANIISTANVNSNHFDLQGELIIPISEIKRLKKIGDLEYVLKARRK